MNQSEIEKAPWQRTLSHTSPFLPSWSASHAVIPASFVETGMVRCPAGPMRSRVVGVTLSLLRTCRTLLPKKAAVQIVFSTRHATSFTNVYLSSLSKSHTLLQPRVNFCRCSSIHENVKFYTPRKLEPSGSVSLHVYMFMQACSTSGTMEGGALRAWA